MRVVRNAKLEIGSCCLKQRILLLLLGDVVLWESHIYTLCDELQLLISVAYILFPDNEAAMPPKLVSRNAG